MVIVAPTEDPAIAPSQHQIIAAAAEVIDHERIRDAAINQIQDLSMH